MVQNPAPQEEAPQQPVAEEPVQEGGRRKRKSRSQSGGKRKMNAYMVAKEKARKGGAASFNYEGQNLPQKKDKDWYGYLLQKEINNFIYKICIYEI